MDIKMMLDPDDKMRKALESLGIKDSQDSEYEIRRRGSGLRYLQGRKEDQQFYISVDDVFFIESMGHDILLHTRDDIYNTSERLKNLEVILDPDKFLRISNSVIVILSRLRGSNLRSCRNSYCI